MRDARDPRRLLLVAGPDSHAAGEHEFAAGAAVLTSSLAAGGAVSAGVVSPDDLPRILPGDADAVAVFADGGPSHPLADPRIASALRTLAAAGVGIGMLHYAVEAPTGLADELSAWIGGSYVESRSCNPMWTASIRDLPSHPVTRGVAPFELRDEWYLDIVFGTAPNASAVTPILVATPSDAVRGGPYVWPPGPYPHIVAARGRPETLMWVVERPDGGRGLGLSGGHFHANWECAPFRRVVLNALVWLTGADVPADGVEW